MDDLKAFRVPVLILSGGEPLLRPDIFEISARAKAHALLCRPVHQRHADRRRAIADRIRDIGYDYVGISLDGIGDTHDRFRRKDGRVRRRARRPAAAARSRRQGRRALHHDRGQCARAAGAARSGRARAIREVLPLASGLCRARQQEPRRRCQPGRRRARAMDLRDRARLGLGAGRQRDGGRHRQQRRRRGLSAALGGARGARAAWRICAPSWRSGAAIPPASTSPTSTIWAMCIPTPCGGTTRSAT